MRVGRVSFARRAVVDIGRVYLWLSQQGAGRKASERLAALAGALHAIAEAPFRWPPFDPASGLRKRSSSGYVILYRVSGGARGAIPDEEPEIEIVRVLGPGQAREIGVALSAAR